MIQLSVVVVSFNTRGILRDCLNSVYAHKPSFSFEVIVVDNASLDGSAEMVRREFPQVKLIRNTANRGFAPANNQGFAQARGRYWLMLNSDTLVRRDVLERSVEYMHAHKEVGMFGCRVLNKDKTMQETCFMWPSLLNLALVSSGLARVFPKSEFLNRERMRSWKRDSEREVEVITGCYLLIRAEYAEKVGWLDEDFFFYGEETDWCRRFREAGYKVMFAPVGEIIHLGGASGEAGHYSRKIMLGQALIRLQRKHNGLLPALLAWCLLVLESVIKSVGFGAAGIFKKRFRPVCRKYFGVLTHALQLWPKAGKRRRKRVLAVSSPGGHWVQLRRLEPVFKCYDTWYASTREDYRPEVVGSPFLLVPDVSRWQRWYIPIAFGRILIVLLRLRPDVVFSTGALPGLLAVIAGRIVGARCVWLDSIANSEELSMSGRYAGRFVQLWLTQWEHLAAEEGAVSGPEYEGKVL